ncbi:phosphatidylglycerophosphatase A [Salipiger sp. IMCC34102]|uniref:phosphatidylglycerophosphatase A family protein n=1 Tax=Salipiger sp. IMCC34102 TaxID=2510647 RepID=UPI00101B9DA9|nr:phosphatidylglycerophosphatase A [Salipiger sp. IMCC34102]RYH03404.1 phosphatidylglycerophosphatase A [Salipiger sp. IMCC34102]
MIRFIATFAFVGYLKPAPGTWGSLAALPTGLGLMLLAGPWGLVLGTLTIFALGLWATTRMIAGSANHDPSEIVVDEVAGQWIALWPLAFGAANAGAAYTALWPGWVAAFMLFRLFDITKWGPVGWADRRGDPLGVMLDDVIAGVFAAVGVVILAGLFHAVLM